MTKILLIGSGHAHLSIIRRLINEKHKDYEITLITPSKKDVQIDLEVLSEKSSVSIIEDTIISFDPMQKMLLCFSGEIYRFDVISFNMDMKFSLFRQALVPVVENGAMLVEDTLQNAEYPILFGAGESVSIVGGASNKTESPDKQADLLWNNMKRYLKGQKLQSLNSGNDTFFSSWTERLFKRR
ncbi:hypothetical protein [Fictibacillus arsenicus]|uniref:FAD/NAD(P)-binding domain-containing protein n=1 Tax=Fictibacillus arsenicus TaxID=255247 RepID=A0A1V3G9I8_9BACL|nr:hypothetical protein [Fictibacillus arsenicus]OOE12646.1 hypothetical protein UN64_11300 [Fictibacillus arsenicus]